ncbi:hypothetical protein M422DRAFT_200395 [Sphaerobolus stellatus SS14]|nr:hypothetical protein M422DRAFT_200395 [Sphaerobolus stellatus SS14]
MSTLAVHQTSQLLQRALSTPRLTRPTSPAPEAQSASLPRIDKFRSLVSAFKTPVNPKLIQETLEELQKEYDQVGTFEAGSEEDALRTAALGAVAASLYGHVLDILLQQATEAEGEANWWGELERSRTYLCWYMVQTFPVRLTRAVQTVLHALRSRNLAITPRAFTPHSLRQLFPTTSRPSKLAISLFPHLSKQTRVIFYSPLELTREECRSCRHALEKIRNDRAERLGCLAISKPEHLDSIRDFKEIIATLQKVIGDGSATQIDSHGDLVTAFQHLNSAKIPQASTSHAVGLSGLRRPSRLTLLWPRLLLIPPAAIIAFRLIYGSKRSFVEHLVQIGETIKGFWENYLLQPFRDILDTVRTGGEEGMRIINPEGVKADTQSLERMALDLGREKYNFNQTELEELAVRIQQGDLTPILKIYEEDLKSPFKSAISGTLIRSLLIQIQKMKVDVDVALSGIDKLLRSQELTFAFVGVAPALAIVYTVWGWIKHMWQTSQGKGKYGGKRRQTVWLCMRRIERLLVLSQGSSQAEDASKDSLTALDQGLILLSVAQLRTFGETDLPPRSRFREEFLIDVSDLEDAGLGRAEKMAVVNRMWRSWGDILKWNTLGDK